MNVDPTRQFAADIRAGLASGVRKSLPPTYFYDNLGSALFDAITLLPEYGLTRSDRRLLQLHAEDLIRLSGRPRLIAELGSGSGSKTRFLLETVGNRGTVYCPIDVSRSALAKCEFELKDLANVEIRPIEDSYLPGLRRVTQLRQAEDCLLLLFLGSTIGNFSPEECRKFCRGVREILKPGDVFLVSTDIEKETTLTLAAYDDALGVTAAFNRNLLVRINRELRANFDISKFRHAAVYDANARRIEMHLVSETDQRVVIDGDFIVHFAAGETIWTESSYKFRTEDLVELADATGFRCETQWLDQTWRFAQSVFRAI